MKNEKTLLTSPFHFINNWICHPFLFAVYPVLFLYSENFTRTHISDTYRIVVIQLLFASSLFLLFKTITRDWNKAGLVVSLFIILFCSFGHVDILLSGRTIFGLENWTTTILAAVWGALFIFLTWFILRVARSTAQMTIILNLISGILIIFPLIQIGFSLLGIENRSHEESSQRAEGITYPISSRPPDIYYIILDEYGRSDVLNEIFKFDNADFVNALKEKGFYIADKSHSNYAITHLSLASSLNYTYLNEPSLDIVLDDRNGFAYTSNMIQKSKARSFLSDSGYEFITIASGYSLTDFDDGQIIYEPKDYINSFEYEYLGTTILSLKPDAFISSRYRGLINNAFESLSNLPQFEPQKPKFVFAHIQAAHVPFVFGSNGEEIVPWAFPATSSSEKLSKEYKVGYVNQVKYVNKRMLDVIDSILSKSETKPIIIIQGDHGPESVLDWQSVERTCLKERMSILNAIYLPEAGSQGLYPSITPVNTFRLVFDTYFGTDLGLLDDDSYFSLWDKSYEFIDITDRVDTCRE